MVLPSGFSSDNVPPEKLVELHTVGPNSENAEILIFKDGIEQFRLPYSRRLAADLDAEIPKVPIKVRKGGEVKRKVLGEEIEQQELRRGHPPIRQFLIKKCGFVGLHKKEIYTIIEQLGWSDGIPWFRPALDENLKDMVKEDLLIRTRDGKYHTGFREVGELDAEGYPIETGPYPVIRLIWDKTAEKGRMSRLALVNMVHLEWVWTPSRAAANLWINQALRLGYLREVEKDVFEPHKRIA